MIFPFASLAGGGFDAPPVFLVRLIYHGCHNNSMVIVEHQDNNNFSLEIFLTIDISSFKLFNAFVGLLNTKTLEIPSKL